MNDLVIPIHSDDPRLGRNINHDARSADHAFDTRGLSLVDVEHTFPGQGFVLDQGSYGYCTAEAAHYVLWSDTHFPQQIGSVKTSLQPEEWGLYFYSDETKADTYPGTFTYPPPGGQDTGSDGTTSGNVARKRGLIDSFQHTFTADDALLALTQYPLSWGTLWKTGMDNVNEETGLISYSGTTRGGHQMCLYKLDVKNELVWGKQSWGGWGYHRSGVYCISFTDFAKSLADQGDVTIFMPVSVPIPPPRPPDPNVPIIDQALLAAGNSWEPSIFSRLTKAGKVKTAFDAWKTAHNY